MRYGIRQRGDPMRKFVLGASYGGVLGAGPMGLELNGMYVGRKTVTDQAGPTGGSVIARPFFDTTTNVANSVVVASPGAFEGGVLLANSFEAYSFEVNPF